MSQPISPTTPIEEERPLPPREGLTKREYAHKWGVSISTIDRRIATGELRVIRSGRIVRILPDDEMSMFEAGSQR